MRDVPQVVTDPECGKQPPAWRRHPHRHHRYLFTDAGLVVQARLVREPEAPEKTPQAYLLARKPV